MGVPHSQQEIAMSILNDMRNQNIEDNTQGAASAALHLAQNLSGMVYITGFMMFVMPWLGLLFNVLCCIELVPIRAAGQGFFTRFNVLGFIPRFVDAKWLGAHNIIRIIFQLWILSWIVSMLVGALALSMSMGGIQGGAEPVYAGIGLIDLVIAFAMTHKIGHRALHVLAKKGE